MLSREKALMKHKLSVNKRRLTSLTLPFIEIEMHAVFYYSTYFMDLISF